MKLLNSSHSLCKYRTLQHKDKINKTNLKINGYLQVDVTGLEKRKYLARHDGQ